MATTSKLEDARRALAAAEASAGLRTALSGPTVRAVSGLALPAHAAPGSQAPGSQEPSPPPAAVGLDPERVLPVPAALAPLFPYGGIRRGTGVQVAGSTSLLLRLAAAASCAGVWCAVVALPDVGLAAAAEAGLPLDRMVVVPRPGPDSPSVVGALVDGFDVLVLGDCTALADRDRRLLASRARTRGSVLLTTTPWPGSELVLDAGDRVWRGVGRGAGVLRTEELTIVAYGRGAAAARRVRVRVRIGPGGVETAAPDEVGANGPTAAPEFVVPVAERSLAQVG
ncbi:hypothetical protein OCAE111667_20140 [Occultella aeris]|uniref:Recombinase A n=1 Tax=Occultella aeris TaxID=2761496 RepID=A0A7M4DR19_9MICO|nr:hypothetical protein [Occultella aeris]VZO39913.1 hypothetical protein HALOF300_04611 [Occultella aeris]